MVVVPLFAAAVLAAAGCRKPPAPGPGLELGPVLGSPSPRGVAVWVQASRAGTVSVEAWPEGSPDEVAAAKAVELGEGPGRRATLRLEGLRPATSYRYRVLFDGAEAAGGEGYRFRTPPEEGVGDRLRIAVGSCAAIWRKPDTGVWSDIADAAPDVVLALGDTPYADHGFEGLGDAWDDAREALREDPGDPLLRAALDEAAARLVEAGRVGIPRAYERLRASPGFDRMARSAFWVATWDDHDTGVNNADAENPLLGVALEAFRELTPNPSFGLPEAPGTFFALRWGDVDLVLLDDSSYRTPTALAREDPSAATMLGGAQLGWLLERLGRGRPTFTLLASGSPFNDHSRKSDSWAEYPRERARLLEAVVAGRLDGLLLLGGDIHRVEVHRLPWLQPEGGYPLWEVVASPLVNTTRSCADDVPGLELCYGSHLREIRELWVLLEVDTTAADPVIAIEIHEAGRGALARRVLRASELRFAAPDGAAGEIAAPPGREP